MIREASIGDYILAAELSSRWLRPELLIKPSDAGAAIALKREIHFSLGGFLL